MSVSRIDDLRCIAHWPGRWLIPVRIDRNVAIDFEVHYFVQLLGGEAKVFGWVSGNEEALLKQHGIV